MSSNKSEARMIAWLVKPDDRTIVGNLYLWDTGDAEPMWFEEEVLDAVANPLPGESSDWVNWTLDRHSKPKR